MAPRIRSFATVILLVSALGLQGCVASTSMRFPEVHPLVQYGPARRPEPRTFRIVDARPRSEAAMHFGSYQVEVEGGTDPLAFLGENLEQVLQSGGIDLRRTDDAGADLSLVVRRFRIRNHEDTWSPFHTFTTFRADLVAGDRTIPIAAYFKASAVIEDFGSPSPSCYEIPLESVVLEIAAKMNRAILGRASPREEVERMLAEVPVSYAILSDRSSLSVSRLAFTNNAMVVPTLVALTDREQGQIRAAAISGLGTIGARDQFDLLTRIYSDKGPLDRLMAAKSIGDLGTAPARAFLANVRGSEDYRKSEALREVVDLYDVGETSAASVVDTGSPVLEDPIAMTPGAAPYIGGPSAPAVAGSLASDCERDATGAEPSSGPQAFATIRSKFRFYVVASRSVKLATLDGKPIKKEPLQVAPGCHVVGIHFFYTLGTSYGYSVAPCLVPLKIEAGHRYRAEADASNQAAWRCWLEDEETHVKTLGYFSAPEPSMRGAD